MMPLSPIEFIEASITGMLRRGTSVINKTKDSHGWSPHVDPWGTDIEGACAEKLVGKATGLYCTGALGRRDNGCDVGPFGVRSTTLDNGSLILHEEDNDERIFILVVGFAPNIKMAGYIRAKDGKLPEFWDTKKTGRPAYFVPQSKLNKIETLIKKTKTLLKGLKEL